MLSPTPINALLLAEDESMLALDRKVMRPLGLAQSGFFASGRKALDFLHANAMRLAAGGECSPVRIDMIVCHERLADMTGLQFLGYLRSLEGCENMPALLLVGNSQSPTALAATASRSCAVLARPYSAQAATDALATARKPECRVAPMALPASFSDTFVRNRENTGASTETAATGQRETRKPLLQRPARTTPPGEIALREGLVSLQRGDTATADKFLFGAYSADPLRPETSLALSRLYAMLHNEAESLLWLCRAGCLYLRHGDKVKAAEVFGRLPRGKQGQTPLLQVAGEALQQGETKASAMCFMEAHRLDPSQGLHALVSRTCMFTPAPEEHIKGLVRALAASGHGSTANKLHMRLLQDPREEEVEEEESFLARFPLLHDIVTVASHTIKAWRHAA